MPAVTIVAACINADTGVGPAIASGSHVYNGSCALLPIAPAKSKRVVPTHVEELDEIELVIPVCGLNRSVNAPVPKAFIIQKIPNKDPRSAIRFIMNAFFAALL